MSKLVLKENSKVLIQSIELGCLTKGEPARIDRFSEDEIIVTVISTDQEYRWTKSNSNITILEDHIDVFETDGTLVHIFKDAKKYDEYPDTAEGAFERYIVRGTGNFSIIHIVDDKGRDIDSVQIADAMTSKNIENFRQMDFDYRTILLNHSLQQAKLSMLQKYGSVENLFAEFIFNFKPYHVCLNDVKIDYCYGITENDKNDPQ